MLTVGYSAGSVSPIPWTRAGRRGSKMTCAQIALALSVLGMVGILSMGVVTLYLLMHRRDAALSRRERLKYVPRRGLAHHPQHPRALGVGRRSRGEQVERDEQCGPPCESRHRLPSSAIARLTLTHSCDAPRAHGSHSAS